MDPDRCVHATVSEAPAPRYAPSVPRPLQLAIFLVVVCALTAGLHRYVWVRLVRDTALPRPWRAIATWALGVLAVGIPGSFALARLLPPSAARVLVIPFYVWLGCLFFLMLGLLLVDLGRGAAAIGRKARGAPPPDHDRRQLVARALGSAVALGTVGLSAVSARAALGKVAVKDVTVPLARLPAARAGFTIVQLTDVHIGPTLGRAWLERIVAQVNALAPDLVAITGDLVDGSVEDLLPALEPLRALKSAHGTYFVTGNHEYYSGAEPWCRALATLGVRVLRNERVAIGGDGADGFDLAGVDDFKAKGMAPGHGSDLPRALAGRDPSRELVLLAHQPRAIDEAAKLGVGLQLSGHTHGGQLWPWTYLVYLQQPYVRGLAKHENTWIYVSQGTGFWGPPMRFNAPAEITKLTLQRG